MKTSKLGTILVGVVLTACALAQENPSPHGPGPTKGTVKAARVDAAAKTASNATPVLAGFDEYVLKTMKDSKVPGAAVAIVKDGNVILSKGYGLRDVKSHLALSPTDPVNECKGDVSPTRPQGPAPHTVPKGRGAILKRSTLLARQADHSQEVRITGAPST